MLSDEDIGNDKWWRYSKCDEDTLQKSLHKKAHDDLY